MSIRLFKTLISIADRGTFTAAAEAIHITHAAVSQQMKALESDLQIVIFDRSKRTPQLTAIGRKLVSKARELVDSYENLIPTIMGDEYLSGELRLGVIPTELTGLAPLALSLLREEYRDLRIHVLPGLSTDLISEVERDRLDAAIVTLPDHLPANLVWRQIAQEPLELLASKSTSSDDPVFLLRNRPFIRFTRQAIVGKLIDQWLQQQGIEVDDRMELDNLESISSMVYCDLGVSIVPRGCVSTPNPLALKHLPLDAPRVTRTIGLVSKSGSVKTRLLDALNAQLIATSLDGA